jgi:DNA topoisomerase-1
MKVVVVESPAKAKTINKYLGPGYTVLASFGHVRDLREKDGAVEPDSDFAMHWEIGDRAKKPLGEITRALQNADSLYLATDPDREGEAISWHLKEVLSQGKKLKDLNVKRVVFNEITKSAVLEAMKNPRDLDRDLIEAYMARRALDFLVGFNLSPVLWRKLPGSRSAGRVQSVALRLICERETEIEPREYWTIAAEFRTPSGATFTAQLTHLDGQKLDKFALGTKEDAERAVASILAGDPYAVAGVEKKRTRRNPFPPFTTSTLQQEASRKLGLGASRTMRIAQQLYEGVDIGGETVGLITYMRTDSVNLSREAIGAARKLIGEQYGAKYVPESPRVWKTKAKNAQEAHEGIRPTDLFRRPEHVAQHLDNDQRRLYELIWRRTLASEMESAEVDQTAVDIASTDRKTVFRATGSIIVFDGFLTLYREDRDDASSEDDEDNRVLPAVSEGEQLAHGDPKSDQHFTQPPPRYSEASLVKRLEELGIGRPSTYASILDVLQDRGYVKLDKRRFIPEDRGRIVTAFLESFFTQYVQYDFTARLEELLDDISGGRANWKDVLREFWQAFSVAVGSTKDLTITQVIDELDEELGPHFFPALPDGRDPRLCPGCNEGRLSLKLGKFGAFIGCSRYPDCRFTRPLAVENGNGTGGFEGTKTIGVDPVSNEIVSLRKGPYGLYLQLGEGGEDVKPKRVSLPKDVPVDTVNLDTALKLLALPREVGTHPSDGKPILAGLGRFGPYLKHGNEYRSLESTNDLLTVGLNRAVDIMAQPKTGRRRGEPANLRQLGAHPDDGKNVSAGVGRYGPFVKHGSVYANLPKDRTVEEITLEEAISLIAERVAKGGGKKKRGGKAAKASATADAAAAPAKPKRKSKAKAKTKSKASEPVPADED